MSVTGWETETMLGESVYRIGPTAKAETHRGWAGSGLTVCVGAKEGPARSVPPQTHTLSVSIEEAELLALALAEAVARATEEEEL